MPLYLMITQFKLVNTFAGVLLPGLADVIGIFPTEAAIIRMVGALLLEQNDEWAIQRRYMSLETLATLGENGEVRLPAIAN